MLPLDVPNDLFVHHKSTLFAWLSLRFQCRNRDVSERVLLAIARILMSAYQTRLIGKYTTFVYVSDAVFFFLAGAAARKLLEDAPNWSLSDAPPSPMSFIGLSAALSL